MSFLLVLKLNYGDIFSFPNKLKFETFVQFFLIMEQKIINNCPSNTLISLKYFALLKYGSKLQTF